MDAMEVLTGTKSLTVGSNIVNKVRLTFKSRRHPVILQILNEPQHTDDGRWKDRHFRIFIVETYIAARNRCVEYLTGITHAGKGFFKSPVHFRLIRVTKIQAVGNGHRLGSAAYNISCCFGNRNLSAPAWIQIDIASVTISFYGQRFIGALDSDNTRIGGAGPVNRIRAYHRI